jgi:hypothetical protein
MYLVCAEPPLPAMMEDTCRAREKREERRKRGKSGLVTHEMRVMLGGISE